MGVSGFATRAVLHRSSVVPVGDDVPPEIAAVLGCAVLTGGGAVINAGDPQDGDAIMIVGMGGVGMAALITAVSLKKGKVIGVDADESKLTRAKELGADEVYTPAQLEENGVKAPIVIEAAGHPKAFETAFKATGVGGKTVTVGLTLAPGGVDDHAAHAHGGGAHGAWAPTWARPSLRRTFPSTRSCGATRACPSTNSVSSTITLDEINGALDKLADGEAVRQVILFED